MSSSFCVDARHGKRGSGGVGTVLWLTAFATLAVVSSVSLVDARPAPDTSGSRGLGHWTAPASGAAKADIPGTYQVAARGSKIAKGAAAGAGAARRGREDKDQSEANPAGNAAQAELPTSGGPQPVAAPPKPETARAPERDKRLEPTGIAAKESSGCVVNCEISSDVRRRAGATQQRTPVAAPAAPLSGGLECIANCGDPRGLPRATAAASGGELRPTTTEGDGRIKVLRGVTRSKVYGVSR